MPSEVVVVSAVAACGGISAAIDLRTRRLPNAVTLAVAALGMTLAAAHVTGLSITGALGGFAVGLLLMLPGYVVGGTGGGDVKLFAAVGTLLGPTRIGAAFVYTAIVGGVLAVAVAVRRGRLHEALAGTSTFVRTGGANVAEIEKASADNRFAYAPAIAVGTLVAALGL